jgi:hypothetical protein
MTHLPFHLTTAAIVLAAMASIIASIYGVEL